VQLRVLPFPQFFVAINRFSYYATKQKNIFKCPLFKLVINITIDEESFKRATLRMRKLIHASILIHTTHF